MLNSRNVRCSSSECFMHNRAWVDLSEWNTRPIEDALRADNAKLKARVEALEKAIEDGDLSSWTKANEKYGVLK